MKLIKREDIHWDIVRSAARYRPWELLGWPIDSLYEKWGLAKNDPLVGKRNWAGTENTPNIQFKLPWGPDPSTCYEGKPLRASITFRWLGFFWFWRA